MGIVSPRGALNCVTGDPLLSPFSLTGRDTGQDGNLLLYTVGDQAKHPLVLNRIGSALASPEAGGKSGHLDNPRVANRIKPVPLSQLKK